MKFRKTSEHLYWWPVEVKIPSADPARAGKFETQSFKMQFAALPLDAAKRLAAEVASLPPEQQDQRQHDQIMTACRDWDESVVDEDGDPIRFTELALAECMQSPWFRMAVYRAFNASLAGDEARRGN